MNVAMTLGLGASQVAFSVEMPGPPQPFTARIVTEDNSTLTIEADPASGEILLTVTVDGTEIGQYLLTETEYLADAHNLKLPELSGTAAPGSELTVSPGLWLVNPDAGLSLSYQWLRDGTPIAGAANPVYAVQAGDAGTTLICRETLGPASVETTGSAIPASPANNLIDVTASPSTMARLSTSPLPTGTLLTQTSTGAPRVGWDTLEDLVTGASYRLRGTIDIPGTLESEGQLIVRGLGANSGDVLGTIPINSGINNIDVVLSASFVSQTYRALIFVDPTLDLGAEFSVTDFTLEIV
jgi:hypothetical protein